MQDEMAHPTLIGLETPYPVHWWEIAILAVIFVPVIIWLAAR